MSVWLIRFLQLAILAGMSLLGNHLAAQAPQDGTERGVRFWFLLFALGAAFLIEKLLAGKRKQ